MSNATTKPFVCGVVEGFYGRPWSTEQRLDLFSNMSQWGMNYYLYAPKDDDKHRSIWRDLYSLEEADHLSMLIKEANGRGVDFIYAISPGLDITFSNQKESAALKRKLDQVAALGCTSFAILFDDIDPDLSVADSKVFPSCAHAQATLANEVYSHLDNPSCFLFCPTEYCGSRAVPSVAESQYLSHLGEHLHPSIDILWTGPKVISKVIPVESIDELSSVLKRPPVIWDNIHANDYDQQSLFLGPYVGRSASLIPKLNGVLTNPNCEYGANFVPIHTLAQWCKCGTRRQQKKSSAVFAAAQLEKESDGKDASYPLLYGPEEALESALKEWILEFGVSRRQSQDYQPVKSHRSVSQAASMEEQTSGGDTDSGKDVVEMRDEQEEEEVEIDEPGDESGIGAEPISDTLSNLELNNASNLEPFDYDNLLTLVHFFYLPNKHGPRAQHVVDEFCWLKRHAPGYKLIKSCTGGSLTGSDGNGDEDEEIQGEELTAEDTHFGDEEEEDEEEENTMSYAQVQEWLDRANNFHSSFEAVSQCFIRLTAIPNRPLLYDLYQYMSDAREAVMLLDSYISWLEVGGLETDPTHQPHSRRGGIVAEMMNLLPQANKSETEASPSSSPRSSPRSSPLPQRTFIIRPYCTEDKSLLYRTCLETGDSGNDATHLFPNYPNLLGDRYVGPYLAFSADLSFVLEDDIGVCGYILSTLDSQEFYNRFNRDWLPEVSKKYPVPVTSDQQLTLEEELLAEIHSPKLFLPDSLYSSHPSHFHIDIMKRAQGLGNGTRMVKMLLSVLKSRGSHGVHLEMSATNKKALRFYKKLGFSVLQMEEGDPACHSDSVLILQRSL